VRLGTAGMAAAGMALGLCAAAPASGHEVRPALLEVSEQPNNHYSVLWKQPSLGGMAVHLVPHISGGLLDVAPSSIETGPDFEIRRWRDVSAGSQGLEGRTLSIEGLNQTLTDVLVSFRPANGDSVQRILIPQNPRLTVHLRQAQPAMLDFLFLGIRHILTGPDHLLFLVGLLLIVSDRWMLIRTVSAFTLAHSLTLAAATLAGLHLSMPLLNALIALSILFVAPEAIRAQRGGTSLTIRFPWVVAFAFGLLHGMGFATGLTSLGLAKSALVPALVLFNGGVEIGQLVFIALWLAMRRAFRLMEFSWPRAAELIPAYAVGILGAFWTFQYGAAALGLP
jgi:hypothetical protein